MPRIELPPEPWHSFFVDVDTQLRKDIALHCCGGFVVAHVYGVARTTNDVDYLSVVPDVWNPLTEIAGKGSALHRKPKVFLDAVTIVTPPENYADRRKPLFPGAWTHLRFFALEAHDLALTKLERNSDKDRQDVQRLAQAGYLRRDVLKTRYFSEHRPNLTAHEDRHDLTLELWLEAYWPEEGAGR